MIRNIIFDMGGVIITINYQQAVVRFKALGLKDADRQLDPYEQQGIFGDLESGKINTAEFQSELSRQVGRELTYDECSYAWLGFVQDVPVKKLKTLEKLRHDGYRVILLSNTNPFVSDWVESNCFSSERKPLGNYFDAEYKSFEQHLMKPDKMFFRRILTQENVLPSETLFVDDSPRNVAAASELGFKTFCPKNGEDWTENIYTYLNPQKI